MARRIEQPVTLDFETEPIQDRPNYPPKPVGVSIQMPGERKGKYYAWAHVHGGNNCTAEEGRRKVQEAYAKAREVGLLNHHTGFDMDVAEAFAGVAPLPEDKVHDTMFLLALHDPHNPNLGLKSSAERVLGMPPEERDAVRDWLVDNKLVPKARKTVGEFIYLAPGDVVGPYAVGDTTRAWGLYKHLRPIIEEQGMWEAYRREQRLAPMLRKNEAEGMHVDRLKLEHDLAEYEAVVLKLDDWIRKRLKAPGLDIGSKELITALDAAGAIAEWSYTDKGNKSMSKKNMSVDQFADRQLYYALGYRNRLLTCLSVFMRPWNAQAQATGGIIHTNWRQVRGSSSGDDNDGARSNRLQSSPNFQNIPKKFEGKGDGFEHPNFIRWLPHLPLMRQYIVPDAKGHVIGRRDYSQQEIRILAHFEDGVLLDHFNENPWLDIHDFVKDELAAIGIDLPRGAVKTINFGMLYGMGLGTLAERIQREVQEAQAIKRAQMSVLPGVKELDKVLKSRGRDGEAIRTWGGRLYYCEPPRLINGIMRSFEYKLLNYLIQGSAADCTKEALCRYHEAGTGDARFMLTVHDEIDSSIPKKALKREMLRLREIMMSVEFDVPMLSDGEFGANWGSMEELKEPKPTFA